MLRIRVCGTDPRPLGGGVRAGNDQAGRRGQERGHALAAAGVGGHHLSSTTCLTCVLQKWRIVRQIKLAV